MLKQRQSIKDLDALNQRYQKELHGVMEYIAEPKPLKEAIKALYQRHVTTPPQNLQVRPCFRKGLT